MTWPIRVLEMNAHHTIVVAEPRVFSLVAVLAIGGAIWCVCEVITLVAERMGVEE